MYKLWKIIWNHHSKSDGTNSPSLLQEELTQIFHIPTFSLCFQRSSAVCVMVGDSCPPHCSDPALFWAKLTSQALEFERFMPIIELPLPLTELLRFSFERGDLSVPSLPRSFILTLKCPVLPVTSGNHFSVNGFSFFLLSWCFDLPSAVTAGRGFELILEF